MYACRWDQYAHLNPPPRLNSHNPVVKPSTISAATVSPAPVSPAVTDTTWKCSMLLEQCSVDSAAARAMATATAARAIKIEIKIGRE